MNKEGNQVREDMNRIMTYWRKDRAKTITKRRRDE